MFSYQYSYFIEIDGEVAGMAVLYKTTEVKNSQFKLSLMVLRHLRFGIFRRLVRLLRSAYIIGNVSQNSSYLSNVALYPKFRRLGIGTKVLNMLEEKARRDGSERIVLDASTRNKGAIRLYKRLGYTIERGRPVFRIRNRKFMSVIMAKPLPIVS